MAHVCIAFPLQQWFPECASILRYTYIACLVVSFVAVNFRLLLITYKYNAVSFSLRLAGTRHM